MTAVHWLTLVAGASALLLSTSAMLLAAGQSLARVARVCSLVITQLVCVLAVLIAVGVGSCAAWAVAGCLERVTGDVGPMAHYVRVGGVSAILAITAVLVAIHCTREAREEWQRLKTENGSASQP